MKILITGGAGFIGSTIISKIHHEHDIVILDNFLEQVHGKNPSLPSNCTTITGNVTNRETWNLALNTNPDIIIHLASETGTGQSMDEMTRYCNTNVIGTSIMLDMLKTKKHNVKKIILSSSRAVYGEGKNIETNTSLIPLSVYALTKLTQEQLLQTACSVPYTIFRYQNVYGPGQSILNPYTGIISIFSEKFSSNEDVTIWDNAKPTRDFVYVDDVVDATLLALNNDITNYKIYNIGTGQATPILDVTKKLKQLITSTADIKITDYHRPGDIMHAVGNIDKIQKELNWQPKYNINQGLEKFYEWFLTQK